MVTIQTNANFHKAEFKALWDKINLKTVDEVNFDSARLVSDARNRINADLHIAERSYEIRSGELE